MTAPYSGRLWAGAWVAWGVMLLAVAIAFATLEFLVPGGGDPDIKTPGELTAMVLMFSVVPLALISFGVFLPMFTIVRRLMAERVTRLVHALIGVSLSVPAFAAFVAINNLLWPRRGKTVLQDVTTILHRPSQILPVIAVFAIGGLVFGLTLSSARTQPTAPANK